MSKWEFFGLNYNNEPTLLKDENIIPWLQIALIAAAKSKVPDPKFSAYYVNCSCLVINKETGELLYSCERLVQGGNIEYGLCQALHGEESLVAALKSRLAMSAEELKNYAVLIAFSSKFEDGGVPTCCGNCRDIMRDALPLNTMIFGGHPKGGKVIIAHLWNLLGDQYRSVYRKGVSPLDAKELISIDSIESLLLDCRRLENDIYFPGSPNPGRRYCAIIKGEDHTYLGAHDVMCDYHPIYAVRDAVRQARRDKKPQFSYVVVASQDYFPDVMYKDRQHLLELNFQQECLVSRQVDPPVYLVMYKNVEGSLKIEAIHKTSVKKWLPFPFSPANFGDEFVKNAIIKFRIS